MAWAQSAQSQHPACPLCGEIMTYNGAAWFCYGGRVAHTAWLESRRSAAFDAQERGEVVFWVDIQTPPRYRRDNWDPSMQGIILARTETGWEFGTVRGANGVTNFRVDVPRDVNFYPVEPRHDIPALDDWRWAEWTGKGAEND